MLARKWSGSALANTTKPWGSPRVMRAIAQEPDLVGALAWGTSRFQSVGVRRVQRLAPAIEQSGQALTRVLVEDVARRLRRARVAIGQAGGAPDRYCRSLETLAQLGRQRLPQGIVVLGLEQRQHQFSGSTVLGFIVSGRVEQLFQAQFSTLCAFAQIVDQTLEQRGRTLSFRMRHLQALQQAFTANEKVRMARQPFGDPVRIQRLARLWGGLGHARLPV